MYIQKNKIRVGAFLCWVFENKRLGEFEQALAVNVSVNGWFFALAL